MGEYVIVTATCPHCKRVLKIKIPTRTGIYLATCPNPDCQQKFKIPYNNKNEREEKSKFPSNGQLVQIRHFRKNLTFRLSVGDNIIGRADEECPSQISIEGDDSISRRSINITVKQTEHKGFSFKFTVLRSTNRVFHNQNSLKAGESIYLNYGDTIILGRTLFRFEKTK